MYVCECMWIHIICNRTASYSALSPAEICDSISLHDLMKQRTWFLQPCSAKKGEGLTEGFIWLASNL